FRAKMMMLDLPTSVAANLRLTRQNMDWQLKRIYRDRNTIVHSGKGSPLLPQLAQHLHSYLIKTIRSLLIELDRQPEWTIRDAFEHRRRLFDHVVGFFTSTPGDRISARTILNPAECLLPQKPPFAWLPPPSADGQKG